MSEKSTAYLLMLDQVDAAWVEFRIEGDATGVTIPRDAWVQMGRPGHIMCRLSPPLPEGDL